MGLNPVTPGLRAIHYNARSVGKVTVGVQPGDELHVPDGVADQLLAADPHFREGPAPDGLADAIREAEAPAPVEEAPVEDEAKPAKAPRARKSAKP